MSPLLETLQLKNGQIQHQEYHQARMNASLLELFPSAKQIHLNDVISIPEHCQSGLFKVRITYGASVDQIDFEPYFFRTIQSLKVVHHENIDYHLKYSNRQLLQELFARRENCDDIIIVKNGYISDSFAANLLFFDGEQWVTPTTPLLKGTKRQQLLDRKMISEKEIREEDISGYQKVGLINAMIDFEEMPMIPVEKIVR